MSRTIKIKFVIGRPKNPATYFARVLTLGEVIDGKVSKLCRTGSTKNPRRWWEPRLEVISCGVSTDRTDLHGEVIFEGDILDNQMTGMLWEIAYQAENGGFNFGDDFTYSEIIGAAAIVQPADVVE
jgi:hypothetical protein